MTRVKYVIRELGRNLYRNPGTSLGSILSLALLFLLFDIFWIAARTSDHLYTEVISELRVDVFLPEELDDSSAVQLTTEVLRLGGVRAVEFISRRQARNDLAALVGTDLLIGYDSLNPLPRSLSLAIEAEYLNTTGMNLLSDSLRVVTGSNSIQYSRNWLSKAEQTRTMFRTAGLALGAIILLTALVSSTNNIRLLSRARNVELRQMVLIGAGKLFVTMPYLLEGFLLGGTAAAMGWVSILYGHGRVEFTQFTVSLPSHEEMAWFSLTCALIGAVSGFLGARRLLRL